MKIKLPKERIPMSTRGTMVHRSEADYSRKDERKEIENELEGEA